MRALIDHRAVNRVGSGEIQLAVVGIIAAGFYFNAFGEAVFIAIAKISVFVYQYIVHNINQAYFKIAGITINSAIATGIKYPNGYHVILIP